MKKGFGSSFVSVAGAARAVARVVGVKGIGRRKREEEEEEEEKEEEGGNLETYGVGMGIRKLWLESLCLRLKMEVTVLLQ